MALAKKHLGFGNWVIIDEAGTTVAGPFKKDHADAYIQSPPAKAKVNEIDEERKYWDRVNADLARPLAGDLPKLRAVLQKSGSRYSESEVELILRQFAVILKTRGRQRRRSHNIVMEATAAA